MSRAGYWCGPGGRDEFYRTFLNDPFWMSVPDLDAMTDREVSEHLLAKYVKPPAAERVAAWEKQVEAADAAFKELPVADQKAAYLAMCEDVGVPAKEAEAEWNRLQGEP